MEARQRTGPGAAAGLQRNTKPLVALGSRTAPVAILRTGDLNAAAAGLRGSGTKALETQGKASHLSREGSGNRRHRQSS